MLYMNKNFTLNDIKKDRELYIGLSHPNDLVFYHNFKTINQLTNCCMGSSFIPGLTHKSLIYFYEHHYTVDGGLWYKHYRKHINTDEILVISPKLFNRYCGQNVIYNCLFRKDFQLYQMYLNGYYDARKNHNYFKKYLVEK